MIVSSGLQFAYGNGARLHFPDVDVPQGGVLLLGGPSGSGKSTWLALAAGLVGPSGGSLQVAGQMLGALGALKTDAWRAQTIGFLPQKLHLSAALTVHHNLALAFWAAGVAQDNARIDAALNALGVADLAQRLPASSGLRLLRRSGNRSTTRAAMTHSGAGCAYAYAPPRHGVKAAARSAA